MSVCPSNKVVRHRCVACGREYPHGLTPFCQCGSMIDVQYDLAAARLYDSTDSCLRYFDLLPLEDPASLLPVRLGPTPTLHAVRLGRSLGLSRLYVKNEGVLPTRTTKDRMALVVLAFLREIGIREFVASSTGNSSTSLGHFIRSCPGCRVYLFTAADFLDRLQFEETDQAVVFAMRGATFVEASVEAAAFARRRGIAWEGGFFNPARREGLKLAFLEAAEAVARPIDWYVQSVSSAMGVYGAFKGAGELMTMGRIDRLPRLLSVQQESCAPMVHAFEGGSAQIRPQDVVRRPRGIAQAILRGDPSRSYPYVCEITRASGGGFVAVGEPEIRDARRMMEELEGLTPCYTAATAVAGLVRMARQGRIPPDDCVLVNLTGADRPPSAPLRHVHWLERGAAGWQPADANDSIAGQLWEARS
jgi:threonine synthase